MLHVLQALSAVRTILCPNALRRQIVVQHKKSEHDHWVMELQFQVHIFTIFHDFNFNDWSNECSSKDCCTNSGLWVCSRKCVYSLHNGINCPEPSSSSGRDLKFIPADTLCRNNTSSHTFVNRTVRILECLSFTSCDFTHVNVSLVTDYVGFSCSFSSSDKPNCSHPFVTAP